jgi:hypothetical protein
MSEFARISGFAVALIFAASACGSATLHPDGGGGSGGSGGASGAAGRGGTGGSGGASAGGTGGSGGTGGASAGSGGRGGTSAGGSGGASAGGTGGSGGSGGTSAGGTGGTSGCSPACTSTQTCVGTKCLTNDGLPCTLAAQCMAGACTPFYADADGDGYGAGTAMGFCGTATPVGYAAQSGDCCDNSALPVAKNIHPGAGYQTTSANGACGVTWDYDCSGVVETSKSQGTCASNSVFPNSCINVTHNYASTSCGTSVMTYSCIAYMTDCTSYPSPDPGTLGCK